MGDVTNIYKICSRRIEGNRQFGRFRLRGENNIKMFPKEVKFVNVEWFKVAESTVKWWDFINTTMQVWAPYKRGTVRLGNCQLLN